MPRFTATLPPVPRFINHHDVTATAGSGHAAEHSHASAGSDGPFARPDVKVSARAVGDLVGALVGALVGEAVGFEVGELVGGVGA
jgi:hypothetical protein